MNRVNLSAAAIDTFWRHWAAVRICAFDIAAFAYYNDKGWDIYYDIDHHTYSIPENQLAFFLLTIENN